MNFELFAKLVHDQFNLMATTMTLYRTQTDHDEIKTVYLNSFPEGTNKIYITNTEHDCSCCKSFIKNIGTLVSLQNGKIITVWDIQIDDPTYQIVADTMAQFVRSKPINSVFYASEKKYGAYETKQTTPNGAINWEHFHCTVPANLFKGHNVSERAGVDTTTASMLTASLEKISIEALDTILDLIDSGNLYRGEEHKSATRDFKALLLERKNYEGTDKNFGFEFFKRPAARYKNTVIGTLAEDLTSGMDLEDAVKSFETKVAPANYKRPKALITQGMIDQAMKTIKELDLEPALTRRHATIHDVNVTDVLYTDVSVRPLMQGGIAAILQSKKVKPKFDTSKAVDIQIAAFMAEIVPTATSIEAFIENRLTPNFVNVIAPTAPTKNLFQWDNNFTWSYNGNVTDSMKDLVKSFGGKVDGKLRFSIMWNTDNDSGDDLDAHCESPYGHIYFGSKGSSKFNLDVDIITPGTKPAVENIIHDNSTMRPGQYAFLVNCFSSNGNTRAGFNAEIEFNGQIFEYHYPTPLKYKKTIHVATVVVDKDQNMTIDHKLPHSTMSKEVYGLTTNSFVKVNTIMLSPNYWQQNASGNKHYMFILDGCAAKDNVRGFYNEFLNNNLAKHRKVFEVLSSQLKVAPSQDQLAGLGFSSTARNNLVVKASNDTSTRMYNIQF